MSVIISFQGPDFNPTRNPRTSGPWDQGVDVPAEGFDLDYSVLTIYPEGEPLDENLILAVRAPYMNEQGIECGEIAWRLAPSLTLLRKVPELAPHVGKVYGRVIVTGTMTTPFGREAS